MLNAHTSKSTGESIIKSMCNSYTLVQEICANHAFPNFLKKTYKESENKVFSMKFCFLNIYRFLSCSYNYPMSNFSREIILGGNYPHTGENTLTDQESKNMLLFLIIDNTLFMCYSCLIVVLLSI